MDKSLNLVIIFGPSGAYYLNEVKKLCFKSQENIFVIEKPFFNSIESLNREFQEQNVQRKTLVIFTSSLTECEHLLSNFKKIIYIHLSEYKLFSDCIMNRISHETYKNTIWPTYSRNSKEFLNYLQKNLTGKYFLIDGQTSNKNIDGLVKQICKYLVSEEVIDPKYCITFSKVLDELNKNLPNRSNKFIWDFFNRSRKDYSDYYKEKVYNWMKVIENNDMSLQKETIEEIIETFRYNPNKLSIETDCFKNIFIGNEKGKIVPYQLIIKKINDMCDLLNSNDTNEDNIDLLRQTTGLIDVLRCISNNSKKRAEVLRDVEYHHFLKKILSSKNEILKMKTTQLIYTMMSKTTFSRETVEYYEILREYEKNYNYSFLVNLFKVITESCDQIFSTTNSEEISKLNFIYKDLYLKSLKLMLESSVENCEQIENINGILKFSQLIDKGMQSLNISNHNFQARILCQLMSILKTLFLNCRKEVIENINLKRFICHTATLTKHCMNILGPYAKKWLRMISELHNYLLILAEKYYFQELGNFSLSDDYDYFEKIKQDEPNEIKIEEKENEIVSEVIQSYNNFCTLHNRKNFNNENSLNFLKDKTEFSIKYNNLEFEVESYKKIIQEKEDKIRELSFELKKLSNEAKLKNDAINSEYEFTIANLNAKLRDMKQECNQNQDVKGVSIEKLTGNLDLNENKGEIIVNSKEDAKALIQQINRDHSNIITGFRKLICGSLKNLSTNLYTSATHFISELIQNTEDSHFESNQPTLKIIFENDSILFCSNEKGFSAQDIRAICGLFESNKLKGFNIGNKGLGFKAVFTCSDNPIIYSKPYWQFGFFKREKDDEIAYITPNYLDNGSIPLYLSNKINDNELKNFTTFIYLPLKAHLHLSKNKIFYEKCFQAIDPNILLFTKKLKKIIIEDYVKLSNTADNVSNITIFTKVEENNAIRLDTQKNGSQSAISSYKVFSKQVKIIDEIVIMQEELKSDNIDISIAFPSNIAENAKKTFNVYSFLPLESSEIRLPFLINSNWSLNTNREDIRQCRFNEILRDSLAEYYSEIVLNNPDLTENLPYILPSQNYINWWWREFTDIIKNKLNEVSSSSNSVMKEKRFSNDDFQSKIFVPTEILSFANIEIVDIKDSVLNQKDFDYYLNWKKLSIEDILKIFDIDNISSELENWINSRSDTWWSSFFYELYVTKTLVDPSRYRIFFQRENFHEKSKTIVCLQKGLNFFTCSDRSLKMWRDEIQIIDDRSDYEAKYIKEILKIPELTIDFLVQLICLYHTRIADCGNAVNIWQDLTFIKNNYEKISDKKLSSLLLPTRNRLQQAKFSKLPVLLGYSLIELPLLSDENIVEFDEIKARCSLFEILQWEYFFIKIGMELPHIDIDLLAIKIESNEIKETFRPLSDFNEKEIELAIKIINTNNCDNLLRLMPIKCSDSIIRSASSVYLKNVYNITPSTIDVPKYALELAKRIGIHVEVDFKACIAVLESFIEKKIEDSNAYIEWFDKLRPYLDEKNKQIDDISKKKLLCLKNFNGQSEFYSISQVYICQNSSELEYVCHYLDMVVINKSSNASYMQIEDILIKLGCKKEPSIQDFFETISMISKDPSIFLNENEVSTLTKNGFQLFKGIYMGLEKHLRKKANFNEVIEHYDWDKRLNLKNTVESNFGNNIDDLRNLPIVTFDHQVIKRSDRKFVCSLTSQVNEWFHNYNSDLYYVGDAEIASNCPFVMQILDCTYLEPLCVVKLSHFTNNMEYFSLKINEIIRQETGLSEIENLNVTYVGASVCYNPSLEPVRKENITSCEIKVASIPLQSVDYAIFDNKWIVSCGKKNTGIVLNRESLVNLLKITHPNISEESINEKFRSCIAKIEKVNYETDVECWENGSSEDSVFNMENVVFPKSSFKTVDSFFFAANDNYIANDLAFSKRAAEIIQNLPRINDKNQISIVKEKLYHYKDHKRFEKIGTNAEYFFCKVLQKVYPESFDLKTDWVSSSKINCIPNEFGTVNNELGYDFIIKKDTHKKFSLNGSKCLVEVKGCAGKWDGTFYLSENEFQIFQKTQKNFSKRHNFDFSQKNQSFESYVIVVIEFVDNNEEVRIAKIIDWTENKDLVGLKPQNYLATYNPLPSNRRSEIDDCWRRQPNNNDNQDSGVSSRSSISNISFDENNDGDSRWRQPYRQSHQQWQRDKNQQSNSKYFKKY